MTTLQCFLVLLSLVFHHAHAQGSGDFSSLLFDQSATVEAQSLIPSPTPTQGSNFLLPDPSVSELYVSPVATTSESMLSTQTLVQGSGMINSNAFLFVDSTSIVMLETSLDPLIMLETSLDPLIMLETSLDPLTMLKTSVSPLVIPETSMNPLVMLETSIDPLIMPETSVSPPVMLETSMVDQLLPSHSLSTVDQSSVGLQHSSNTVSVDLTMPTEPSLMTRAVTDLFIFPTDTLTFLEETASIQLEPLTTILPLLSTIHTPPLTFLTETVSSRPSLGSLSSMFTPSPRVTSLRLESTFIGTISLSSQLPLSTPVTQSQLPLPTSVTQSRLPTTNPLILSPSSSMDFLFLRSSDLISSIAVSSSRPLLLPLATSEVNNMFSAVSLFSPGTSSLSAMTPFPTERFLPSTLSTRTPSSTSLVGQRISDTIDVTEFIFLQTTRLFDTITTVPMQTPIVPSAVVTSSLLVPSLFPSGSALLTSEALFLSPIPTSIQILQSQFTPDLLTQAGTTQTPGQSSISETSIPGPTLIPIQPTETIFSPTLSPLLPVSSPRASSDEVRMSTSLVFFVDQSSDIPFVTSPNVIPTLFSSETFITLTSVSTTLPSSLIGTSTTASPTQTLPVQTMLSTLLHTTVSLLTSSLSGQVPISTQPTTESIANVLSMSIEILAPSTPQGLLPLTAFPTTSPAVSAITPSTTTLVDRTSTRAQVSFSETITIQVTSSLEQEPTVTSPIQTSASSLEPTVTSPIQTSASSLEPTIISPIQTSASSLEPTVISPIQTSASSLEPTVISPIQTSASSLEPTATNRLFEPSTSVSHSSFSLSILRETLTSPLLLGSSNVVPSTIAISLDSAPTSILASTLAVSQSISDVSPISIQPTTTSIMQVVISSVDPGSSRVSVATIITTPTDPATLKRVETFSAITTHFPSTQPMGSQSTMNLPPSGTTVGSSSAAVFTSSSSTMPSPLPSPMICPSLFTLGTIIPVTVLVDIELALTRVEHQAISLPGTEGRCGLEEALTKLLTDFIASGTRISRRQASGTNYDADIVTVSALSMSSAVVTFYVINGTSGAPLPADTIVSVFTVISPQQINTYPVIAGATIREEATGTEVPIATDSIIIPLVAGVGGVIVILLIVILVALGVAAVWQRKKGHIAVQNIDAGERGTFVRTNDFESYNRQPSSQSTPQVSMTTRQDPVTLSHLANGSLEIDSEVPGEMEGSHDNKQGSHDLVSGGLFEHVAHYSTPPQPSPRSKSLKMRFRRSVAPSPSTSNKSQHSRASDDIGVPTPAALKPKARSKVNEMEAKRLREDALRLQEQHEEDELRARRKATLQRMVLHSRQSEDISRGGSRRKKRRGKVVSLADPRPSTYGGVALVNRQEEVDPANLGDVEATTPTATPTTDLPAATSTSRPSTKRRMLRRKATNRIAPLHGTTDGYLSSDHHRTTRHSKKFKSGRSQRGRPLTQSGLPISGRSSRGVAKDVRQELAWMNTGNGVQLMSIQPITTPPQLISLQPRPAPVAWEKLPSVNQLHSQSFTQRQLETYLKIHQDMEKLQLDNHGATPTTTQATPTQTTTKHERTEQQNAEANQNTSAADLTAQKGDSKAEDPPPTQAGSNLDSSYSSTVHDLMQQAFSPTGMRQDTLPWQPEYHTMNSSVAWQPAHPPPPHVFTPTTQYTPHYSTLQPQTGHLVWSPDTTNSRHVQSQMMSPAQLSQLRMTPGISVHPHDNSNYGNMSLSNNSQWVDPFHTPGYHYY